MIPNIPVSCWLKVLRRRFNATSASLEKILQQGKVLGYLNNAEHKNVISGLVGDIQDAMIDYQVIADVLSLLPVFDVFWFQTSIQQAIYDKSCQLIVSVFFSFCSYLTPLQESGMLYALKDFTRLTREIQPT